MKISPIILSIIALTFFHGVKALGQGARIANVNAEQNFKNIIVSYDIKGSGIDDRYNIKLLCSTNGGRAFGFPLEEVSGDIGYNIGGGNDKQIIWDVLSEVSSFSYTDVVFKVIAEPISNDLVDMVFVEGASFIMGNNSGEADEKPAHQVLLSDFYMSRTEITVGQYKEFCEQSGYEMPASNAVYSDNHPITYVSHSDATAFCEWLSEISGKKYRLPTEAEWEYAARGGAQQDNTVTKASPDKDNYAWSRANTGGYGHNEVKLLKANSLGLYDMIGNVWEWCDDWYSSSFYRYSPPSNPKGPPNGKVKVARGGSWREPAEGISNMFRFYVSPTAKTNYLGFRIVREQ